MGKVKVYYTEPSKTVQSEAARTDINVIVARAKATGSWSYTNPKSARYLDCTLASDFQAALEKVRGVEEVFSALDARIRDRFKNDPMELVRFVQDKANEAEARELGLLKPVANIPVDGKSGEAPKEPPK